MAEDTPTDPCPPSLALVLQEVRDARVESREWRTAMREELDAHRVALTNVVDAQAELSARMTRLEERSGSSDPVALGRLERTSARVVELVQASARSRWVALAIAGIVYAILEHLRVR